MREDADVEAVWGRVSGSKKPVGLLLMDQAAVAGIGNIYRAEILFKVRAPWVGGDGGCRGVGRPPQPSWEQLSVPLVSRYCACL